MNQRNIGQTGTPSVKLHQNPGGKTNWSFGWSQDEVKPSEKIQQNTKYHNQSQVSMNDGVDNIEDEEKRREEDRRRKQEQINNKLPTYDPKNGNKTNIVFGDDKPDYRRKNEVQTSVKIHNPPGGRSNIQFG